jgi:hypothetical protein
MVYMGTERVDLPPSCQSRKGKTGRHRAALLSVLVPGSALRSYRHATELYSPPRPSFIVMPPKDPGKDSAEIRPPAD